MNPKTALMVTAAILLIVANLVEEDGSVAQIADMQQGELRERAGNVADMSGFTPDSELGPQESETDRSDDADREIPSPRKAGAELEIADFSWDNAGPNNPVLGGGTATSLKVPTNRPDQDTSGLGPDEVRTDFDPRVG